MQAPSMCSSNLLIRNARGGFFLYNMRKCWPLSIVNDELEMEAFLSIPSC